jgi:hypothetical protein
MDVNVEARDGLAAIGLALGVSRSCLAAFTARHKEFFSVGIAVAEG